jgi:hypothetical protein
MENISLTKEPLNKTINFGDGKKESIESAKFSVDTTLKDAKLKDTLGRTFGGVLGGLVLLGSLTNVFEDFKSKKKNPWVYSRIILDFMASGALIGYALENTLLGLKFGLAIGALTLILELFLIKREKVIEC